MTSDRPCNGPFSGGLIEWRLSSASAPPSNTHAPRRATATRETLGESELSTESYRIDYDNLDVVDLASQISARARRADAAAQVMPEAIRERARARVRAALDGDDSRAHELQRQLQLEGTWNVTPEDLTVSLRPGAGTLLSGVRRALRPILKLFANVDLPLYKQFKINLGIADTLNELLCHNAELQARVEELGKRVEELEAARGAPHGADHPD